MNFNVCELHPEKKNQPYIPNIPLYFSPRLGLTDLFWLTNGVFIDFVFLFIWGQCILGLIPWKSIRVWFSNPVNALLPFYRFPQHKMQSKRGGLWNKVKIILKELWSFTELGKKKKKKNRTQAYHSCIGVEVRLFSTCKFDKYFKKYSSVLVKVQ